ncbi:non-specific serine/threonine protein kinase OS=Streptomyces fumanus OX=67302 GN=GCM10018772_31360 PE=3 SV=1 [Streptomyces fumanus]|uniref:ATP-binding protein n=2 Tax=Streptomyces fumanus TaxID=67302 RepID=A0A919E1Y8_9ACTN|nr:ATP-binding protein [Streptomyces fumanus]
MTGKSAPEMTILLSATRRGARLARLLTERQLKDWDVPSAEATHVAAELAANAVLHGRVPGRDFRLSLSRSDTGTVRIEVTDARCERIPRVQDPALAESGRGLLIVEAYADRWGFERTGPVKTVWAEVAPDRGDL